ncbi:hypothetical protein D3C84_699650 [compost metagenome]
MGNVEKDVIGVAILFADMEKYAAGHSLLHQHQVAHPHGRVVYLRVYFSANDRKDHRVVLRFDVLLQQGQLGCRAHRVFLTVHKSLAQHGVGHGIGRLHKVLQVSLILRTDVQFPTQLEVLHHRQGSGHLAELARGRFDHKA